MDDLISRQAAIDALENFEKLCWEQTCFRPLMPDARVIIKGLHSVQPEQMRSTVINKQRTKKEEGKQ